MIYRKELIIVNNRTFIPKYLCITTNGRKCTHFFPSHTVIVEIYPDGFCDVPPLAKYYVCRSCDIYIGINISIAVIMSVIKIVYRSGFIAMEPDYFSQALRPEFELDRFSILAWRGKRRLHSPVPMAVLTAVSPGDTLAISATWHNRNAIPLVITTGGIQIGPAMIEHKRNPAANTIGPNDPLQFQWPIRLTIEPEKNGNGVSLKRRAPVVRPRNVLNHVDCLSPWYCSTTSSMYLKGGPSRFRSRADTTGSFTRIHATIDSTRDYSLFQLLLSKPLHPHPPPRITCLIICIYIYMHAIRNQN